MRRVVWIFAGLVVALYVVAIFLPINPDERRPGTRLSGTLATDQNTDWSFIKGRTRAWVETRTPYLVPHSITVSAWADEGVLYVGCIACNTKNWPRNVARDDRVRIKIGDRIYQRRAIRITDDAERRDLLGPRAERPGYALFRMDPR